MTRREQGTGSVYEDPKRVGRWVGEVSVNGKRRRVSGTSKADVSRKLRALTAKRDTGQLVADRSATVAQALAEFLERDLPNRDLAPKTLELYNWTARLIVAEIGAVRLADLTVDRIEAMLDRLATREQAPLSRSSLTKVRGTLQRSIAFAERRGKAIRNPATAATITPLAARSQPRQALGPDDARTLLAALREERDGLMFALSLRLGLRPGEAAALYWHDVDNGVVNVVRGLRRDRGRPVIVDEVKTKGSRRTIELPADLADWLADHRRRQLAERIAAPTWADDRIVFPSRAGTVTDPTKARRRLAKICVEAGVTVVRPNELRHSCASLLSDAGVPLELIADLLGHASTDMLDRTYRHRLRPSIDVAARATWAD
ncbi:tyrosine-type recombinase/integrase [Ilumatobacter sp.]|uniref:tyrosine-type recombinase/integrase n=1 Tax=Ilumatobacter sp. TaxID=1967498 RepID=UPI003753576A